MYVYYMSISKYTVYALCYMKWLQLQLQKFLDPQKHALIDNIFICPSKRYENNANHHH
jgi:hypothetical protein